MTDRRRAVSPAELASTQERPHDVSEVGFLCAVKHCVNDTASSPYEMVLYETDVITRLDASIRSDTDEWPEFALNQVRVTAQGTGDPVSLLAAHGGFFVTVEGVLEEIDKHYVHLGAN